ncbi:MAG TPA: DUF368 domain-containing protein [Clostridiales bacterium]|nr:DUF368 domain-containing protein [Clostridiales bacterium]
MNLLLTPLKGALTGIAMLIPGVSGGTMAIILGIYDHIIHAISTFFRDWKKNTLYLLAVGIGAAAGIGLFSNLISRALDHFRHPMIYLFLGIVIGGLPVLFRHIQNPEKKKADSLFLFIGLVIVLLMTLEPAAIVNLSQGTGILNFIFLVLAGVIIAVALILPGISTSFMLLTLGLYEPTIDAVKTFNLAFLIPVLLGCLLGVITTTRILETLLNKHTRKTYLLILGFVLGSIMQIFPGIPQGMDILYCLLTLATGYLAIRALSRYFDRVEAE